MAKRVRVAFNRSRTRLEELCRDPIAPIPPTTRLVPGVVIRIPAPSSSLHASFRLG